MGRQVFGTRLVYRETFRHSSCVLYSTLSAGIESMEFQYRRAASFIHSGKERNKHKFEIRDASLDRQPKILSSLVVDTLKNYGADQQRLQILELQFDQIPFTSNLCLLEDKVQDRGMYLFTILYGSYAIDQGSGDG